MEAQANRFGYVTRHGILTLDDGCKQRVEFTIKAKDLTWHNELEKKLVKDWNDSQPMAVHKVVSIHLMRN